MEISTNFNKNTHKNTFQATARKETSEIPEILMSLIVPVLNCYAYF